MQYSAFSRSTVRGLHRPVLQGAVTLTTDSIQVVNRPSPDWSLHHFRPSHSIPEHANVTTYPANPSSIVQGAYGWTPVRRAPESHLRPSYLPLPCMSIATPRPHSVIPFEPSKPLRVGGAQNVLCWFGSPCAVSLTNTSPSGIKQHLLQFHTADIDMPGSGAYALPVVDVQRRVREGGVLRHAPQACSSRASQKFWRRMSALRAHAVEGGLAGATSGALLSWFAIVASTCVFSLRSYLPNCIRLRPIGHTLFDFFFDSQVRLNHTIHRFTLVTRASCYMTFHPRDWELDIRSTTNIDRRCKRFQLQ
ncbi:uncharacterized protein B0H18DRAFT_593112 [Fomitopsis serialis]|uniref:uncharacterized protein n=1 Tax=Fomitopsis serialis TaxID=139415 RepID=UPI0020086198|nr:uncharacterized protein B0H18DRAFT_593112 [Neoantrodia serialis]KAH9920443.1 hypothetical protein B0H18DRAFT_593112 [Neoantrodia serialis]